MKSGNTLRVARNSLLCFFMALVASFLVACGGGGGGGGATPPPNQSPIAPSVPPAPTASAQSDTAIEVTWSAVSRATSYRLYRSPSSGGTYTRVGGDISALRHLDGGLSASTPYYYRLEACNRGGCSSRSLEVSATTLPVAPAQPSAPSASAQSDIEILVTWSAVSGATSYRLYRSPSSGGTPTQVGGDISALSYLDSGRSANTEYFYQLEACNAAGCSSRSPEVSATTQPPPAAPARPSAPSASAQSESEIEVTWSAVSGATSYKLYRSLSSGGTYTQVGGDISALSYLDSGRSANTEYFYQLEACNRGGCSEMRSPEVSATTAPAQPATPSASAQSDIEIEVTWSAVSGATSYRLYRSLSSGGTYTQVGGDISALSYLDSGRSAGTEYFYQLEACNSGGCSSRSPEVSATTFPVAPAQPSASAQSESEILVTWSAVSGATSYKLFWSTSSGGAYTQVGGDISALRYLDRGRSANTEYFYQLEACNSAGCSRRSPEVSATTAPARPATPSASAQSDTEISVTWSAVSGATSYRLYRSPSSGGAYTRVGGDISALRYLDSGRSAGTEYFYQLEACNSAGCSSRSPEVSATTAPARPATPSASAQSDTEISVTWSAVSGATSYRLYRSPSSGGTYTRVGGDISALSYLDSGRSADTEYFYQLEACNSTGCSSRSPAGSATTLPVAPTQPSVPSASAQSESEILVTWSAVSGATSYKLYRSPSSGGTYTQVGGDISALSYLDSGRSADTEYFYQLEACNSGGCSSRSPEVSATTQSPPVVLARPAAPSASAQSDSEIEVTWSAVPGATSYKLYRSPSSGGTYTQVGGDISARRYLDGGLSANTEYFYQLEACNSGGCSNRSPEGSATTMPSTFLSYLSDAAVQGVEYSGPTGDGLTGKGGVFLANEGVFEFSIGGTTLGSIRLDSGWEDSHVTPADFMGVDEEKAIDIARIMQGLDDDGDPQTDGILISQSVRENALDLFPRVNSDDAEFPVVIGGKTFMIPAKDDAMEHFVATRQCLFSGGYVGSYRATVATYNPPFPLDEGQSYFVLEPFANRIRGVEFSDIYPEENNFELVSIAINVGAIGSVITLAPGNELSFVTPRLVTGIWSESDGSETESGTYRLILVAGNPRATRRVVGVETDSTGDTAVGLYVLDYFDGDGDGSFSGQYYDVETDQSSVLSLTIANGGSWPTATGTTTLTLSGTFDEDDTAVTVGIVRMDEKNYGGFEGVTDAGELSGTWCDIGGAAAAANLPPPPPQSPPAPSASAQNESEILVTWSAVSGATSYKLYRSTSSGGTYTQVGGDISARRYLDSGRSADTEYFYQLEACNSGGCSSRSDEVSVTTRSSQSVRDGQCSVGDTLMAGDSCEWKGYTFRVGSDGRGSYAFANAGAGINIDSAINGVRITFVAVRSGNVWEIQDLGGAASPVVTPAQPAQPSASARSESEIEVTWSAVSGATRYRLYRSTSSGGSYSLVDGDISALRYLDRGRSADTEYFYQLEACNSAGCSSRSPEVSATTQSLPAGDGQCRVGQMLMAGESCEWKGNTFRVRSDGRGSYAFSTAGTGIYIRGSTINGVRITFVAVRSGNVWEIQDLGEPVVAPAQPARPSASAQSDTEILVTWSAVSGATSYKLYRSTSGGPYSLVDGDISALRYLDSGRSASTQYSYQLEACNSAGCSATRSPEVSATTQSPPVAPTRPARPSASAQSDTEIEVTWNAVSGATRYKLYRSRSRSGGYAQIGGNISARRYLDRGRSADTTYYYQLEACNSGGCSSRSLEVSATTQVDDGQCRVGDMLRAGESCEWKEHTFMVQSNGSGSYFFATSGASINIRNSNINGVIITFVAVRSGNVWEIQDLG